MGSRLTASGTERVYAAADMWVKRALWVDDSLFTPGKPIWSKQVLEEVHRRFLDQPDESRDSFLEKLERQLKGGRPEVYQLMGEALYIHFLYVATKNSGKEQEVIGTVLNWSLEPTTIPPDLVTGLTPGIGTPGTRFFTDRPFQVAFLIEVAEQLKEQEPAEQRRLLGDPWRFKEFVMGLEFGSALMQEYVNRPLAQREALFHLVFPDTFEAITSVDQKERIAKAFSGRVAQATDDVDRQLQLIRQSLTDQYEGSDHFFYTPEIRGQWDEGYRRDLWDEFVQRAQAYVDTGKLGSQEIDYKVEIGRKLATARTAVLNKTDGWADLVKRGIAGKLIVGFNQIKFRNWIDASPDDALQALREIWAHDTPSVYDRIGAYFRQNPHPEIKGPGSRMNVASVLLMALDAQRYVPFNKEVFGKAYDFTGYARPESKASEVALYEHALAFLDRFIDEASQRDLTLRHRLDAQSVVWAFRRPDDGEGEDDEEDEGPWSPANVESLARKLLWQSDSLEKIIDGLQDKRQAIFQGPPGTGKTYVAKRIAEHCQAHGGGFKIVQFHPSYSYEDFVEGFRPTLTAGGQAGFKLTKGPLRRIAEQAEANPDATFILVIDEINRGNVAKILGELYFLLEYRGDEVNLQYSNEPFSLPKNLWFIGTMNTTDRSIALVDAALRRRFYFFNFFPDEPPVKGLLGRWLAKYKPELNWVTDLVDRANRKLGDRHMGIGPSHFMKIDPPLDEKRVRFIWEQAVIPYIEEQSFGDENRLKEFAYDQLKGEVDRDGQPGDGAGDASD